MKHKLKMNNELLVHYARILALEEAWKDFEKSCQSKEEDIPERPSGQTEEQDG